MNHYELDEDRAFNWMTNEKQYIYDVEKVNQVGYSDFQFISSWDLNYKSWKVQKKVRTKFIRYEDLSNQTFYVFKEIIEFINQIIKNNEKINLEKIKRTLRSTSFSKMKKKELENGFSESINSQKNKNKKIVFFNLGPDNDWKKILNEKLKNKLNKKYEKQLEELSYN